MPTLLLSLRRLTAVRVRFLHNYLVLSSHQVQLLFSLAYIQNVGQPLVAHVTSQRCQQDN